MGFGPGTYATHATMADEVAQMAERLDEPSPFGEWPPGFMEFRELD